MATAALFGKLTCGLCGFVPPGAQPDTTGWAQYYRAVYCVGPDPSAEPTLSGVGFQRPQDPEHVVPAAAHQRLEEGDPGLYPSAGGLVRVRDVKPPGPEVPAEEQVDFAWGFVFHEACWAVLEQAVTPASVDVPALWRVLCSVPCGSDVPNWGHNYGGLYMGTMRDQTKGEHFVLLGRNSNLVIPSTFSDPYKVPEIERLVANLRIRPGPERDERDETDNGGPEPAVSMGRKSPGGSMGNKDPFALLPTELKELLLSYTESPAVASLRLASRAMASMPLTQHFFRSRFWPEREMHAFFDAFLLPESEVRGTDWTRLYWQLKTRLRFNRVCLGERNRLRIWNQTIKPLTEAVSQITKMSPLMGGPDWIWDTQGADLETDWKILSTSRFHAPLAFGEVRRAVYRAEVEIPADRLTGVFISFVHFFNTRYITGLRFVSEGGSGVEIGYILSRAEEYLPVYGSLDGFFCAVDECGFRALALLTGQHMVTEYLSWVGEGDSLSVRPLKSSGTRLRKLRASFDVSQTKHARGHEDKY
ncbi:hypothetical protein JX266_012416 [Neoarthrinium moseri]|nr:hypothetical protein JX266_012416 [Neoarthrinium moseri]